MQNSEFYGYIRDRKTGNVLGIQRKSSYEELSMNNQQLVKQKKEHLIEFDVLPLDYESEETEVKKAGRPKSK